MSKILIALTIFMAGCSGEVKSKISGYACNEKQLALASAQFELCNKSNYQSSHCLATSYEAHCYKINKGVEND